MLSSTPWKMLSGSSGPPGKTEKQQEPWTKSEVPSDASSDSAHPFSSLELNSSKAGSGMASRGNMPHVLPCLAHTTLPSYARLYFLAWIRSDSFSTQFSRPPALSIKCVATLGYKSLLGLFQITHLNFESNNDTQQTLPVCFLWAGVLCFPEHLAIS
jgi:hypothetical protein